MKRTGNLIQKISEFENLQLAFYKAKKGKEAKPEIIEYSKNLNENLKTLQKQIETGNVNVGNYHYFKIYDPKERTICAASFNERVLHHAIMNVCHNYFEKYLIFDTYATRINKGTYKALERAAFFQKKYKWFYKFDIRKYFDNIDHFILQEMLNRMFKDKTLMKIFNQIIGSYTLTFGVAQSDTEGQNRGLPIGNLTSQYFANLYLGKLDHYIKNNLKIKAYVRYMDDFTIWHNNKAEIKNTGKNIAIFLKNELNLQLKYHILNNVNHGLSFLSYRIFTDKILLSAQAKKRFSEKMKQYNILLKTNELTQEEFANKARALTAFTEHANSKGFRKKVIEELNNKIILI